MQYHRAMPLKQGRKGSLVPLDAETLQELLVRPIAVRRHRHEPAQIPHQIAQGGVGHLLGS
jgi:hypothetical protein